MGLLTGLNTNRVFLQTILRKWEKYFIVVSYIFGILWLLLLSCKRYNLGCYFSENALLPGLVDVSYDGEDKAASYLKILNSFNESADADKATSWILRKFQHAGLEAEAIIISAPYRTLANSHESTNVAIALMLSAAEHFINRPYWAKDIIFVISDNGELGIQAWLQAYYGLPSGTSSFKVADLSKRGGAIQAAVNLDLDSLDFSAVDVKYLGANGQLPNLDLVNLIHWLCKQEGLLHIQEEMPDHPHPLMWSGWKHNWVTLLSLIYRQATGISTGNHGSFLSYGIPAVTLKTHADSPVHRTSKQLHSLHSLGRLLEGTLRSLNNLLERLHQSYFFYLMPSTDRFISIGLYMPSLCLIMAGLLLQLLLLWFEMQKIAQLNWLKILEQALIVHLLPVACMLLCTWTQAWEPNSPAFPYSAVSWAFIIVCLTLLDSLCNLYDKYAGSWRRREWATGVVHHRRSDWHLLKSFVLLEVLCVVFTISTFNFSLAWLMAAIYVPALCCAQPWSHRSMLMLAHPFVVSLGCLVLHAWILSPDIHIVRLFTDSLLEQENFILRALVKFKLCGVWVAPVYWMLFIPIWYLAWGLCKVS